MGLDPATTTPANVPNNAIRWNSAGNKWEKLVSGAWQAMASRYAIDVATVMGYAPGNASGNIPLSNGTLNTNLNADTIHGYAPGTGANQVLTLDGGGKVPAGNLPVSGVTAGTYRSVTVGADGRVTGGSNPTTLAGYGITDAASINGNTGQNFSVNNLYFSGGLYGPYATNGRSAGDIVATRGGGTTGYLFLNNAGDRYLGYDGTSYALPNADLYINFQKAWHAGNFNPANYAALAGNSGQAFSASQFNGNLSGLQLSAGNVTAESGGTAGPGGLQLRGAYNNGYPITYGSVLHMDGNGGQAQLLLGWSGSSTSGNGVSADNYVRSLRDGHQAWSPWAKIWTDQNFNPANYLGVSAQAADSAKLNGQAASFYAPNASPNFSGTPQRNGSNLVALADMPKSLALPGYQQLPTGLIFQFAKVALTTSATGNWANVAFTWPEAFPNGFITAFLTQHDTTNMGQCAFQAEPTVTGGSVYYFNQSGTSGISKTIHILGIGY